MLPGGFVNWLWYRRQDVITRDTITFNPTQEETQSMKSDAKLFWGKNFAKLIEATTAPFVNYIYDRDPIDQFAYENIALIGDAAHPARPHRLQASSMAIKDAWVLGICLGNCKGNLNQGLKQFEEERVKETSNIVLFSRYLGDLKQGNMFPELKWTESNFDHNRLSAQNRLLSWQEEEKEKKN
jgi:2-polyprenyl-6-methoxyphenol hydroxylase-like FAD-dependent oxidoreductase